MNKDLYSKSGIKNLEENLATFLSSEKASVFIAKVIRQALQIVDDDFVSGLMNGSYLPEQPAHNSEVVRRLPLLQ